LALCVSIAAIVDTSTRAKACISASNKTQQSPTPLWLVPVQLNLKLAVCELSCICFSPEFTTSGTPFGTMNMSRGARSAAGFLEIAKHTAIWSVICFKTSCLPNCQSDYATLHSPNELSKPALLLGAFSPCGKQGKINELQSAVRA
jgi:hypothetical protein